MTPRTTVLTALLLLVILNPALKSTRIEVGYSLEGGLTDLHMGRIARDQLAPYASYAIAGMAVMDVLHYPLAGFEELKRLERIDASLPLEYQVRGDYAIATSRRPATGFVPILLQEARTSDQRMPCAALKAAINSARSAGPSLQA